MLSFYIISNVFSFNSSKVWREILWLKPCQLKVIVKSRGWKFLEQ